MATQQRRGWKQNHLNSRAGYRAKQTCGPACGATRQSREKRQRRKELDTWQCGVETEQLSSGNVGLDASRRNGGGAIFGKPHERMFNRTWWSAPQHVGGG